MSINHDRLFKELLTTFFDEFIELFLPEVNAWLEPNSLVFLDKEIFTDIVDGESHEVDLVATGRFRHQDTVFLLHVETQASRQSQFARRMFKYFARLHEKHGLPVYPVALLTYATPKTLEPDCYTVEFPERQVLVFQFHTIQLNRLHWRDYLQQSNPVASALMAKMAFEPHERPHVKAQCLRLLVTLKLDPAKSRFISGFIDTYLRLNREELVVFKQVLSTEMPLIDQEKIMELTTSWKEEGLQQGLQQGLEQGLQQGLEQGRRVGERSVLKRLLIRRFTTLPAEVLSRIEQAVPEQLEQWIENTLDATSLEDVFREN